MTAPDLIDRCAAAAYELKRCNLPSADWLRAWADIGDVHVRRREETSTILTEFLTAIREPAMLDRLAARLDWADDERVRAAERETAERVIRALVCEISDAPG